MKTRQKFFTSMMAVALGATLLQSCKKEPDPNEEGELITSVRIQLVDSANSTNTLTFSFRDLDGDNANAPVQFDSIELEANHTYYASMELLDESKNPVESITEEIIEEADDHLFVYKPNPSSLVSIQITDKDSKNLPLGVLSTWRTNSVGRGAVTVVLKHQPGVKNGTEAPGDTDVEVEFTTIVR
jgi:hypothetical protein